MNKIPPTPIEIEQYYQKSCLLVRQLHNMMVGEINEDNDALIAERCDAIRDEMEVYFYKMPEEYNDRVAQLSADLWKDHDAKQISKAAV